MGDIFDTIETAQEPSKGAQAASKALSFYGWRPSPETLEPIRHQLMQKLVYPATELTSSFLGGIGDLLDFANEVAVRPITEKISGKESLPFKETPLGKILPTSERMHRGIEEFAGEKIKPETLGEELLGTGMGFLGSIAGLGGLKYLKEPGVIPFTRKVISPAFKTFLTAFAPSTAYVASKRADLPPELQVATTLGTSLLTHKLTNKSLFQINNELYSLVDQMAKGVMLPTEELTARLNRLQGLVKGKGLTTGPKGKINGLINEMLAKSEGGAIPLENMIQWRKDIIDASKEFSKAEFKGSEGLWKLLRGTVDETIGDYEKLNPKFGKVYREANSLYRGLKESRRMESFLKKNIKESALGIVGSHVLSYLSGMTGAPEAILVGGKLFNFARALKRNPGFRNAYKNLLKSAVRENVKGTTRALRSLNEQGKKEGLKEEKKDIFDELD